MEHSSGNSLMEVINTIEELNRHDIKDADPGRLHNSEMHLIMAIGSNPKIHVSGLAEVLGVTKGAVSQTLGRLEKKGLIVKSTDPENLSRLNISLTEEGETLYRRHEEYHHQLNNLVQSILDEASPENRRFLDEFLAKVSAKILEERDLLNSYL